MATADTDSDDVETNASSDEVDQTDETATADEPDESQADDDNVADDKDDESTEGTADEAAKDDGDDEASDEIDVRIGKGAAPAPATEDMGPAPTWAKELRRRNRELSQELARARAQQPAPQVEAAPVLPPEPTPDDDDVNWDSAKLVEKTKAWVAKKAEVERYQAAQKAKADEQQKKIADTHADYIKKRDALKKRAPDMDDAELWVQETFDQQQQAVIVQSLDNAPLVVLALKRDPKTAKKVAAIKDPLKLAAALGAVEKDLNVTSRKPATRPEQRISGGGNPIAASDPTLARLEAEADRTGNRAKVQQYKRDQAEKRRK